MILRNGACRSTGCGNMLKLTNVKKMSKKLGNGEFMSCFPLPELSYRQLKRDFTIADHLAPIENLDFKNSCSVMIKCQYIEDGLLAASYICKKYEAESAYAKSQLREGVFPGDDFDDVDDEYPMDVGEDDWDEEEITAESVLYSNGKLACLPVISSSEFANYFTRKSPFSIGLGAMNTMMEGAVKTKEPYWLNGDYPVVVEDFYGHPYAKEPFEHFDQSNRLLIYVSRTYQERKIGELDSFEKSLLFETSMEYCALEKPTIPYYEKALDVIAKAKGYKISQALDKSKLVKGLMEYRGAVFRSTVDIETFVAKAIHKKRDGSKTIKKADFSSLFIAYEIRERNRMSGKLADAASELDRLIGLDEVKVQLIRSVKRMKFDHMRRNNGYSTSDTHMAAVFMGSPGTAKTTVARIFGKMLCEENILANDIFQEIARKDLVGQYVGWTAPTVARLFEEAKGGTIFIDEAYSLLNEGAPDGYSEEALSEIIRQMENNPDTLVIFAGYSDKMRNFIQEANPGLRSRLTNVIEFKDYSVDELCEMFTCFTSREDYELECPKKARNVIKEFLERIMKLPSSNMGNGRLVRRLFKTALGYMAEREDHDLRTLKAVDIENAANEIWKAESFVSGDGLWSRRIGFIANE